MKQSMKNYWKKNGFYVILTTALVVVLCISGVAGYRSGMKDKQVAENAAEFREAENAPEVLNERTEEVAGTVAEGETTKETAGTADTEEMVSEEANTGAAETFGEEAEMVWPVKGEVLKPFSSETTVYFETLDQYKCNPALLIKADVNAEVVAAFGGSVTGIREDSVTGMTITVDMGEGYTAVYGQMKDIKVKEGDRIVKGQAIGNVAQPTKYFTEEGSHLHFALSKEGTVVNPQDYLK